MIIPNHKKLDDIGEPVIRGHATFVDMVQVAFIAGYVAFAGIYWIPGVSLTVIAQVKIVTFGVLLFIGLLRVPTLRRTRVQCAVLLGLGSCSLAVFVANTLSTDVRTAVHQARDFAEPAFWLIALCGVRPRAYSFLFSVLTVAMTMFFLVSLYPVAIHIDVLPNLYPPENLFNYWSLRVDKAWTIEAGSVLNAGFCGARTGWGVIVALSALMTIALYKRTRLSARKALILGLVITGGSVASIVVTSARGGTFALVAVYSYGLVVERELRWFKVTLIIGIVLCALVIDLTMLLPENFFRGFDVQGDIFERLNAATTGRFETYRWALKQFASSPIIGVGPEQAGVRLGPFVFYAVHNIWLRALAESGLVLFVPMLLVTFTLMSIGLRRSKAKIVGSKHGSVKWPVANLVILCGLVLGLVEPSVIFGSFNANVVFWTAVWMALSRPPDHPLETSYHEREGRPSGQYLEKKEIMIKAVATNTTFSQSADLFGTLTKNQRLSPA